MSRRYRPFDPFERGGAVRGREGDSHPATSAPLLVRRRRSSGSRSSSSSSRARSSGSSPSAVVRRARATWTCSRRGWSLQSVLFVGSFADRIRVPRGRTWSSRCACGPGPACARSGIRRAVVRTPVGRVALVAAALIALILSGGAGTPVADAGPLPALLADGHHRPGPGPGHLLLSADAAVPPLGRQLGAGPRLPVDPRDRRRCTSGAATPSTSASARWRSPTSR